MSLLDMIGPVMIGPSSSHTAGACRLGLVAHHLLGEAPRRAVIGLHASFAKTGRGHGTHLALVAGLLGFSPDDPRLPHAFEEAQAAGLSVEFKDVDLGDVHPNTAHIDLHGDTQHVTVQGSSTGGGVIQVTQVQGLGVNFSGASPTVLLRYTDAVGMIARIATTIAADGVNIAALTCTRENRGGQALLAIELDAPLSEQALAFFNHWPDTNWVRLLPKLMDG
ncbi:L-serine ammonia-lyase, iron-sulfur-dependent, subunit beta [Deinococcus metallilatus]|uniref:L-serine dehydratase n=2 Tax=Deinococcus TaxID=1298 RepID=A0AAJ5JXK8_9DEIO|nr:L-serine ammonia-lyase, iron-sulfur-dependent subunit beta [Deinococcus metallilatus]MBB5296600.1 L-serine dehydratase [Deinococcus metallilatus]QBY08379.1 L-serine ammonia-lyase, iron-sulfur-dependent, subunit beta [Deinococcus metallilatus]RXJ11178.1 L-serine ammonia-lyase, iron-sulfur-dependent, subunit beta [Deinococcus metallilatus]TLK24669.1 L-serine ammonia-lyase, iron-sulfur-dependent, subunit beta [Deinococcus metallilatus]GMA17517.1 L-serine dehydratase, iron-sulfur-dependent subu